MSETVLANGVRILSERVAGVRSVAVGVWVRHGAAHDAAAVSGASHLLEHMVFKGTRQRSPREIALSLESLGGSLDAYTTREHTGFQARVLDEHLPLALDVLADLTVQPLLRDEDLELEREVVLEEIAEVEDTPDDLVFELHGERLWPGSPWGRSILGTTETVGGMSGDVLRDLHGRAYRGGNLIVAAAGSMEHPDLVEAAGRLFGGLDEGAPAPSAPVPAPPSVGDERVERDTAQSHVVMGTALPGHRDPSRYALVLLSAALGGGMSSRLFQKVREELGLCYTVFTHQTFYADCGVGGVYVGSRPATEERAVGAIREELAKVASEGLPAEELEQTKEQVKGQVMLSLESTGARLYRLTSFALNDEPWMGLDELLARVDAVTPRDVLEAADRYFHPARQLVLRLGPI
ncbi:MAG: pitrilysin family protein [Longimicrobiales bacterium]|nr:pitrilysin family protein [Longimicrobiales bacterium]